MNSLVEPGFASFLESAPDAALVVDESGKIVMVNALTERMFGYTRDEMLGCTVELLVPERLRAAHAGHRRNYFKDLRTRRMGAGQSLWGRRKDGTEFPVEISLSPIVTGGTTLVTSIIRDISAHVEAEAKFRGLLESAPDGIVVVDSSGRIAIVNTQTERIFGYNRNELIGQRVEVLVPDRYQTSHSIDRQAYTACPRTRPMGAGLPLMGKKKDGAEFPIEISLSPLKTESDTLIISIIRDITKRREAEDRIKASLREKEVLLKEIHHRVKNNLQVTSSLLRLQSSYTQDPGAREMFIECQNRIRSMALVHEKLYQSSDLSRINMSDYAQTLGLLLMRSFGIEPGRIRLEVPQNDVMLPIGTAVPSALILNELISNCLKHAFSNEGGGTIRAAMEHRPPSEIALIVADNGKGLPAKIDFDRLESLGLRLVHTLTQQLEGHVEIERNNGTVIRILFPDREKYGQ